MDPLKRLSDMRVSKSDFINWLDSAGKSPTEMALKSRLRDIVSK